MIKTFKVKAKLDCGNCNGTGEDHYTGRARYDLVDLQYNLCNCVEEQIPDEHEESSIILQAPLLQHLDANRGCILDTSKGGTHIKEMFDQSERDKLRRQIFGDRTIRGVAE